MNDNDIDAGLVRALHHFANAETRWEERRQRGLTNEELAEAIRYEFGESGGSSGRSGEMAISFEGLKSGITFWYGEIVPSNDAPPTFSGMKLINRVRRVMRIPQPTPPGQLRLFAFEME